MPHPASITPNPGGALAPNHVLGRDAITARYWSILENRSLVLVAPRRLGKSSVCRRMEATPHEGFKAVYRSLEGRSSGPLEFAELLFHDAERGL